MRAESASSFSSASALDLEEIRSLIPVVQCLFTSSNDIKNPLDLSRYSELKTKIEKCTAVERRSTGVNDFELDEAEGDLESQLGPQHEMRAFSGTRISLSVTRIGLKDAEEPANYINPHITVNVVDHLGDDIQAPIDTGFCTAREHQHLIFDGKNRILPNCTAIYC